jgi:peptidoglycan/LPS O-acetylase OafA/YrhL
MNRPNDSTAVAKTRLVGLDLLRLLAVMLVLGRHMAPPPKTWPRVWKYFFHVWSRGGWVGVDLFFVLSGFLVSGLLFAEYKSRGRLSIVRFYVRRGWRIYPPFYAMIAFTVIVFLVLRQPIPDWPLISEIFFLQSYLPGLWNHTWSLAVEEHFYLLLPIVLAPMLKLNRDASARFSPILLLALVVAVAGLLLRLLNWHNQETYSNLTHLFATHLRFDSLFFGVAISYAYHFHSNKFIEVLAPWRWYLLLGGGLLLTPAFALQLETTPFIYTAGLTLFYLGSGSMLVGVLMIQPPRSHGVMFLAMLGTYSYSIYLWHLPMAWWGIALIERTLGTSLDFAVRAPLYLSGSLAVGVLMAKLVEVPTIRLRDRWYPSKSSAIIAKTAEV